MKKGFEIVKDDIENVPDSKEVKLAEGYTTTNKVIFKVEHSEEKEFEVKNLLGKKQKKLQNIKTNQYLTPAPDVKKEVNVCCKSNSTNESSTFLSLNENTSKKNPATIGKSNAGMIKNKHSKTIKAKVQQSRRKPSDNKKLEHPRKAKTIHVINQSRINFEVKLGEHINKNPRLKGLLKAHLKIENILSKKNLLITQHNLKFLNELVHSNYMAYVIKILTISINRGKIDINEIEQAKDALKVYLKNYNYMSKILTPIGLLVKKFDYDGSFKDSQEMKLINNVKEELYEEYDTKFLELIRMRRMKQKLCLVKIDNDPVILQDEDKEMLRKELRNENLHINEIESLLNELCKFHNIDNVQDEKILQENSISNGVIIVRKENTLKFISQRLELAPRLLENLNDNQSLMGSAPNLLENLNDTKSLMGSQNSNDFDPDESTRKSSIPQSCYDYMELFGCDEETMSNCIFLQSNTRSSEEYSFPEQSAFFEPIINSKDDIKAFLNNLN